MSNQYWNKVLIVDDEPAIRWVLAEALRDWGYETVEAETGATTLAALRAERPAAILLDINLPDSSGLDLLREIKRHSPEAAVIMITAETLFENAVAALRGGADDFISKPVNLGELRFALDQTLQLKRQGREPEPVNRPSILIISDSAERIPRLQSAFDLQEVEIASAVFPEEWGYVSGDRHDLAVVDVSHSLLEPLLGNLRASKEHAEIPVLVEQSRIAAVRVAGVLPKYRAMPCNHDELIRLAHRRLTSITSHEESKPLL
ncbi:MAG TPA: response regulator [Blastocatellia bacterium]|nr:response regulator [Blastocatellia bacterium]